MPDLSTDTRRGVLLEECRRHGESSRCVVLVDSDEVAGSHPTA